MSEIDDFEPNLDDGIANPPMTQTKTMMTLIFRLMNRHKRTMTRLPNCAPKILP